MKFLFGFLFMCSINTYAIPVDTTESINKLMTNLYQRGQFNGSVIVAVKGES